jgi:uncharacterized membrane protein YfcA
MQDFSFYFGLGWQHIISWKLLIIYCFIAALSAIYLLKDWKQVLILVTAFTIGHSLTLVLSVLDIVRFSSKWVEFLIPCTIVVTAFINLFQKKIHRKINSSQLFFGIVLWIDTWYGFCQCYPFYAGKRSESWLGFIGFNVGLKQVR